MPPTTVTDAAATRPARPTPERLSYTLPDAVEATGLSEATLRRHAKAGRLRLYKVGGRTLVCAVSLRDLLTAACDQAA